MKVLGKYQSKKTAGQVWAATQILFGSVDFKSVSYVTSKLILVCSVCKTVSMYLSDFPFINKELVNKLR